LAHWNRKHESAVFVPVVSEQNGVRRYRYGDRAYLGLGTNFLMLLKAMALGSVYYDPALKIEGASSNQPRLKRRSQFRVHFNQLSALYKTWESVDVCA
ncbi:MAG: MvaI/BcnI family restriction endonuclease, partial [Phycisphaerales bacterium]